MSKHYLDVCLISIFLFFHWTSVNCTMSAKPLILPKPSASDFRVNKFFSDVSAVAIHNGFSAVEVRGTTMRWLVIEAPLRILPNIGPRQQCVRLLIDHEENYKFQVLDVPFDSGKLNNTILHKYLKQMQHKSGYGICPGVEDHYMKIKDKLKRKPIVLHEWPRGIRYDHVNCEIWFHSASSKVCKNCDSLIKSMNSTVKKNTKRNNGKKTPSKTTNLKFLTPKTRRRTLKKKSEKFKKVNKKLEKYESYMCRLDSQQGTEMKEDMDKINQSFSSDLDQIFKENDSGDILKSIWENDMKQNRKEFYKGQERNIASDSGSRYSVITYRVALAVFSRSPAVYEALKSFNILQLPSLSTMKTYMRSNREEPGPVNHRLAEEKRKY